MAAAVIIASRPAWFAVCSGLLAAEGNQSTERAAVGEAGEPIVLIVGGGQGGLSLGARLQLLGVPYAVIEADARVGDSWSSPLSGQGQCRASSNRQLPAQQSPKKAFWHEPRSQCRWTLVFG